MYRLSTCCAMALAVVVGFAGCAEQGPAVNYVEGVVTLDGSPIEGVTVGFSPVEGGTGVSAVGQTDSSGVFKLTSSEGGVPDAGAVAGEYNVTFTKTEAAATEEVHEDDPNYEEQASSGGMSALPTYTSVIPKKYTSPATSGFKVTVKAGKNTGDEFKFPLTSEETSEEKSEE